MLNFQIVWTKLDETSPINIRENVGAIQLSQYIQIHSHNELFKVQFIIFNHLHAHAVTLPEYQIVVILLLPQNPLAHASTH